MVISSNRGVVKFPSSAVDQADERFCGQCGRMCQPLINDNKGFGPCVDGAPSVLECPTLQRAIVSSIGIADASQREVHPETKALIQRLGIPASIIAEWVDKAKRVLLIRHELRQQKYVEGSALNQVADWIGQADSDERLIALIEELKVRVSPDAIGSLTFGDISNWYAQLSERAAQVLADPGDWEAA